MDYVFVGKVVNTHGIKGEIRISSDFEMKSTVFVVGNEIIIRGIKHKIMSYRIHKGYDMVTLEGLNDINQVLDFKGQKVFVDRASLNLESDEYILEDLIDMLIINNDCELGVVSDYTTGLNPLLVVLNNDKTYYIPLKGDFITSVDKAAGKIYVSDEAKELML